MIIGMRGHDFGRMEPRALALAIREAGFEATQLAFAKAFPAPAEQYMTPGALSEIRSAFAGIVLPVMGCYVSASDRDPDVLAEAKARFKRSLSASVILAVRAASARRRPISPFPNPSVKPPMPACWISPARSAHTPNRCMRSWALNPSRCIRSTRRNSPAA